jgi:pimeloyl-ACP methyl ester carboxylesterase
VTAASGSITDVDWSRCEHEVVSADGADLACWHRPGDGAQWVLWVHGARANHLMWGRQVDAFPEANHVFLDVRGLGESPMPTGRRVAFADVVTDIGRVLDAYGIERAVLVGDR